MASNPFSDPDFGSDISDTNSQASDGKKNKNVFEDKDYGKETGALRSLGDTAVSTAQGFVRGGEMLASSVDASSGAAKGLRDADEWLGGFKSGGRRAEQDARAVKMQEAAESGSKWEEIKAYGGAFAEAPIDTTVESLGTMAPAIAANVLTRGRGGPALGSAIGGAQGAGAVKSEIYGAVKDRHLEDGATEEEAEARASKSQSYSSDNLGQIGIGAGLGVLASGTGVERSAGRLAGRGLAGEAAQSGVLKSTAKGVAKELPTEAAQGGQEQYAANLAEQNEGFDTPTWQGVTGSATLEGLAGGLAGGGFGAAEGFSNRGRGSAGPEDQGMAPEDVASPEAVGPQGEPPAPDTGVGEQASPADPATAAEQSAWAPDAVPPQYRAERPGVRAPMPSEEMGLNPDNGPISGAAALAVDSGAAEQAALEQAAEAGETIDTQTGEVSVQPTAAESRRAQLEGALDSVRQQASEKGWDNGLLEQYDSTYRELSGLSSPDEGQTEANDQLSQQDIDSYADDIERDAQAQEEFAAIEEAASQAASSPANAMPEPTDAQKEAGNYAKGHARVSGLDVSIENPRGSIRSGKDRDGNEWSREMSDHYGYIKRTKGVDGDHVDVYVGPQPNAEQVFVVDQIDQESGKFDEHKVMMGYPSQEAAIESYSANFDPGWKVGPVRQMGMDEFKGWLKDGDTTAPATTAEPQAAAAPQPGPTSESQLVQDFIDGKRDTAPTLAEVDSELSEAAIKRVVAKQMPDMTDAELQTAIDHYGPKHKRTAKLKRELAKRQGGKGEAPAQKKAQAPTDASQAAWEGAASQEIARLKDMRNRHQDGDRVGLREIDLRLRQVRNYMSQSPQEGWQAGDPLPGPSLGGQAETVKQPKASQPDSGAKQPDAGSRWESMSTEQRAATLEGVSEKAPWMTKKGALNVIGKRLASTSWSKLPEATRSRIVELTSLAAEQDGQVEAAPKPAPKAKPKKPVKQAAPKGQDAKKGAENAPAPKGVIGKNRRGNRVIEDDRGVRSYIDSGIKVSESVGIEPGGGYIIDKSQRPGSDFETVEEASARKEKASSRNTDDKAETSLDKASDKISDAKKQAALELKELLKSRKGSLNSGVDPEVMLAVAKVGALTVAEGTVKFTVWARDVINTTRSVGIEDADVKPFLKEAYGAIASNPEKYGVSDQLADDMDLPRDIRRANLDEIIEGTPDEQQDRPEVAGADTSGAQEADGAGERGGVSAQPGSAQADTGRVAAGKPEDVEGADGGGADQQAGRGAARADVAGSGSADGSGSAGDGRQGAGRKKSPAAGARKRDGGTDERGSREPVASQPLKSEAAPGPGNFHYDNPLEIVGGGQVARFNKNQAAIERYNDIRDTGRPVTADDQRVMAAYTGWGSFGQELFQGTWQRPMPKDGWQERDQWMRDHLGQSEWEGMQASIINAHYTDPPTVMAMWDMIKNMGFEGGRVLEPSMGIGNFYGMMPSDLKSRSNLAGIELDPMTGGMAKLLYPNANINVMGYEKSKTPDNFYDVVVGNWPFADIQVPDRRYQKLNPNLHDYFFLKALDQTRPGGLVVGITSHGSMDKRGKVVRNELARKGELIAAYRLPSGAFKEYAGTSVVTDIIILRKRAEPLGMVSSDAGWLESVPYKTPSGEEVFVNEYFVSNPDHVVGTIDHGHGTTSGRPGLIVNRPSNVAERLKEIASQVPKDAFLKDERGQQISYVTNHLSDREGSLVRDQNGELGVVRGEYIAAASDVLKYAVKSEKATQKREAELDGLIDMRRAYGELIDAESNGTERDAKDKRAALKKQYDAHVKAYGNLTDSFGLKYLRRIDDPFYPALAALERQTDKGAEPADILTRSTMRGRKKIKNPSVSDAYILARNESVNPTLEKMAELTGKPESEIRKELIDKGAVFDLPNGDIEAADIYLSGNVRHKMREAQAALEGGNTSMQRNIKALERVMPADIPSFNIEAQMGATWVAKEYYEQFVAEMLGLSDTSGIEVTYRAGRWKVSMDKRYNQRPEASSGYGTDKYRFSKLVNAAISNQTVKITGKDPDGKEYVLKGATEEANGKIAEMRMKFSEWVWSDPERRDDLEREYNEVRNSFAKPTFDGSFMSMEGMALTLGNGPFDLRKHQQDAIWRALVTRKSLNAHEVGTGKTFTMGGIAVESRRYGIAKKPLILAHNANSKTVANEINQMYPAAKVLYIDNLKTSEIATRMRQIANDDWDAIVMPHSLINNIGFREETLMQMAQQDIDEMMEEAYEAAKEDGVEITEAMLDGSEDSDKELAKLRSPTAKELVKARNKIIANITKQAQKSSKEGAAPFEELGIDMVLVDEVHEFKKPPIATKMRIKGMNTQSSERSIALRFMLKHIRANNGGGNVHTFSGTPITNSMTEAFHQMRYIMEEEMREAGLDQWDGWFGSFAQEESDIELTAAGEYEAVTRLSKFINTPELRRMFGQYMDVVFSDDMPEMQPRRTKSGKLLSDPSLTEMERAELLNGRTENAKDRPYKQVVNTTSDLTPDQKRHFAKIQQYAQSFRYMTGKQRQEVMKRGGPESPIVYEGLAARVSFDARLMSAAQLAGMEGQVPDDPNSKASRVIDNLLEVYRSDARATQAVFTQLGLGKTATKTTTDDAGNKTKRSYKVFSTAHDIVERLVQQGIPREEIAMVTGGTGKAKRAEIAEKMNRSEIRIVIGSTQSLGVGVNMQKNLRAMHHLDAPWMPGDLEQRNGRGHRQGNQWNTVREYRYLTDRIDGRRWQLLVKKQQFIEKFMKSDDSMRIIEAEGAMDEESDILESFAEAAGDARILQIAKIEKDIEAVKRRERLHSQGIASAKRQVRVLGKEVDETQGRIERHEEAGTERRVAEALSSNAGSNFSMTVNGKTYDERAAAQEAIKEYATENIRMGSPQRDFATYGDLTLTIGMSQNASEPQLFIKYAEGLEDQSSKPTVTAFEARLRGLAGRMEADRKAVKEGADSIARAEQVSKEPFQQADQLVNLEKRLDSIQKDLEENPVAPPAWLRTGAPVDVEIQWNGKPFTVTGHRWNKDGWYVLAEDDGGATAIPYMEVKDKQGVHLYEEREFESPLLVEKEAEEGGESSEAPRLRRGPASRGMDAKDARKAVMDMMRGWKDRPKTTIADTLAELPAELRGMIQDAGAEGDMRAVIWKGHVYVMAPRVRNRAELEEVVLHEVIGHYGLRKMLGRELSPVLAQVYKDLGNSDRAAELKETYFPGGTFNERNLNHRLTIAEELIAHLAETGQHQNRALLDRVLTAIRNGLRRIGFTIKIDRRDLLALLDGAQRTVEDGGISRPSSADVNFSLRSQEISGDEAGGDTFYHGTSFDAARDISESGTLLGPVYLTPRKDVADEYSGGEVAIELSVNDAVLKVDLDLAGGRLLTAEEANHYLDRDGWTIDDYINNGDSVGVDGDIKLSDRQIEELSGLVADEAEGIRFSRRGSSEGVVAGNRKPSSVPRGQASAAVGKKASRMLKGKLSDLKPAGLGALPLMYLRDFAPKSMTALDRYLDQKRVMDADRNEMHSRYDAIAQRWLKLRIGDGNLLDKTVRATGLRAKKASGLDKLMHDATIMGIDPSKPRADDADKAQYAILRKRFESLTADEQQLFNDVRDAYSDQIKAMEETIQANIEKSVEFAARRAKREMDADIKQARDEMSGAEQEAAIEAAKSRYRGRIKAANEGKSSRAIALRQKFEQMRVEAPYFPLKRFGDYFVSLRDKNGDLQSFSMFESAADMEDAAEQLRKLHPEFEVSMGRKSNKEQMREAIDPTFIADLQELVSEQTGDQGLTDSIYQMYLETLPDLSMRKGFIHRSKVPGYSEDAMRAFASSMFHSSHQIARLKHKLEMDELVEIAEEQANEADDAVDAMTISNELRQRHEWVMNPQGSKVAQRITSAAFIYQLGITPAAALVNTSQTFMIGVPVLGTRFNGQARASAELLKASKDFITGRGKLENSLKGEEKAALAEFERMGLIEKTQAHDLAGVGDTGVEYSAVRQKVMGGISFLFHHAERYNREVTSIAAYRMARKSGMDHQAAIKEAADLTWTTHFDYSSGNRARYMQNDTAKVLLVFRQYSINMLARLAIDARAMFKGESKQVRREAFRRLAGMYGMFALMAGMMGVPGAQAVLTVLEILDWDDEDPWTAEDKIKRAVTEALNEDFAAAFFNGVPGTLSGTNLTDRIGMGHLWFFSPYRELEGRDRYVYWMEQMLGAAPAMVANAFSGASMAAEGQVLRGIETAMPKAGKDMMRAVRYSREGVQSLNGYSVVDEVGSWDAIAQAIGFTPAIVAEQYDRNSAIKGAEQRILRERRAILNRYALAVRMGDTEMRGQLWKRIADFNRRFPTVMITRDTVAQSMLRRQQSRAKAEGGVRVDKRLDYLRREAGPSR